jgi:transcriptional regulator with XRE-family HTH domain
MRKPLTSNVLTLKCRSACEVYASVDARSGISQNLMATALAPVDSREVVRCDRCSLVQFRTSNSLCRRCHASLDTEIPEIALPESIQSEPESSTGRGVQVAAAIRNLRQRSGLSQRQLALRMRVPRTYVSKIENEKATPTLSSLERLAEALRVGVPDLLAGGNTRQAELRELLADQFVAELLPFISQLNAMQMTGVLTQVRDMSLHIRRSA